MTVALISLLFFGILTVWVQEMWAWSVFQVGVFTLAAVRISQWKPMRRHRAYLPLCSATVWPFLQLALGWTLGRGATWLAALEWLTFVFVFLVTNEILSEAKARSQFLQAVSLGASVVAILSVAQNYSSAGQIFWLFPSGYTEDVLGPFVNRNQYAAWIELVLPVAIYLAFVDRRLSPLHTACASILFSSVIASGSRTGAVLAVIELLAVTILVVLRAKGSRKSLVIRSLQFAGIAALAVVIAGSQTLRTRLRDLGSEPQRVDALQASLRMIADRPWMGSGLGTWSTLYPRYASIDTDEFMNQAHNDWAQWAAEGGVPFVLLFGLFAACLLKPSWRSAYGIGVIALLLHAFLDYPMQQRPALAAWFFAMAGAVIAEQSANSHVA